MNQQNNPFDKAFDTPKGAVPFNRIKFEHYEPAIRRGLSEARKNIDAIAANEATPDFENTIVALENASGELDRVLNVFYPLLSAHSDDRMMNLSVEMSPLLSEFQSETILNEQLWNRIKHVYDNRESLGLDDEDRMLLKQTYDSFADSGALLQGADREKFKQLHSEISRLTTLFGQNVLKELNQCEIWLGEKDLDGLPAASVETASMAAAEKGREGEYLFTLDQPVYVSFMKNSERRDLRERFYRMYTSRNTTGEFSNIDILKQTAEKRSELAKLLGYNTFADYKLRDTMARKPANVFSLLDRLRDAYKPALADELHELRMFAEKEFGLTGGIKPWDYSFYANKLKKERYDFDEEKLRPYFELGNTIKGVFGLATKLYGITFEENKEVDVYHPDVRAFDVIDTTGEWLGLIYTDFFPRRSKRPGAWMTDFRPQWKEGKKKFRPHVSIVMNFTKPTASQPSLLTPYEVTTFLHEFGHALHGLFANTRYRSLSGTNVYRDFVELPSQFNENFMRNREFLDSFARHYLTGEPLPKEDIDRIIRSAQFGAAYACLRQLNFGYLDMAWHSIEAPVEKSVAEFEHNAGKDVEIFDPVEGSLVSPQFSHIFSGGYAAGYYSYKWAEVLDADAFACFEQHGVFNREVADSFRRNVLEKGGTVAPDELYRRFRGSDATIDALLRRDGLKA